MNKTLKFAPNLVPLILSSEKKTTWRLFDDKGLQEGDIVDFLESGTKKYFATARLIKVIEKSFSELTDADWDGHEKFNSEQEMYDNYKKYYGVDVNSKTKVKIIKYTIQER